MFVFKLCSGYIALCLTIGATACIRLDEQEFLGRIEGCVLGSQPVVGSKIRAYALDPVTGERFATVLATAISDGNGCFAIDIQEYHSTILLMSLGGETEEYWHNRTIHLDDRGTLSAAVLFGDHTLIEETGVFPVFITPITTLLYPMALGRLEHLDTVDFSESLRESNRLLQTHFLGEAALPEICESNISCLSPADTRRSIDLDISGKYGLILIGLSAVTENYIHEAGRGMDGRNIFWLTKKLTEDIRDALLDGEPYRVTSADTLRTVLATHLLRFLSDPNSNKTGVAPESMAFYLEELAGRDMPEMFGPTRPPPWSFPSLPADLE